MAAGLDEIEEEIEEEIEAEIEEDFLGGAASKTGFVGGAQLNVGLGGAASNAGLLGGAEAKAGGAASNAGAADPGVHSLDDTEGFHPDALGFIAG